MDILTGFTLKSEDLQLTDFSKSTTSQVKTHFAHLWLCSIYSPWVNGSCMCDYRVYTWQRSCAWCPLSIRESIIHGNIHKVHVTCTRTASWIASRSCSLTSLNRGVVYYNTGPACMGTWLDQVIILTTQLQVVPNNYVVSYLLLPEFSHL